MKFTELANRFKGTEQTVSASNAALEQIQDQYLWDVSGAEIRGWGSAGSGQPFNAFLAWNSSF